MMYMYKYRPRCVETVCQIRKYLLLLRNVAICIYKLSIGLVRLTTSGRGNLEIRERYVQMLP